MRQPNDKLYTDFSKPGKSECADECFERNLFLRYNPSVQQDNGVVDSYAYYRGSGVRNKGDKFKNSLNNINFRRVDHSEMEMDTS